MVKSDIQTLINTNLADASGITAAEHRDTLKDDSNSILESIYSVALTEQHDSVNTVTTSNANFDYDVTITEVGSMVNISGYFFTNNSVNPLTAIFNLQGDYEAQARDFYGTAHKNNEIESIPLRVNGTTVRTIFGIFAGERFYFEVKYRKLN